MSIKRRLPYIDILNCIAIFFVLVLHTSQLAFFGNKSFSGYRASLVLQVICAPAVYIFFMNSGATLLNYREKYTTKTFFEKRFKRVLVPFLIWSVLYYLFDTRFSAFPGPMFQAHPSFINFLNSFLNNNINNLFWFFYTIIALYIATPILSCLVKDHKQTLFAVVIVYFTFTDFLNYFDKLLHFKVNDELITQPLLTSSFVGYFILGYLIKSGYLSKRLENILMVLGILALVLSVLGAWLFKSVAALNNIGPFLYSSALFIGVKRLTTVYMDADKNVQLFNFFKVLSGASLGIYILHPLFFLVADTYIFGSGPSNWNKFLQVINNPIHIFVLPIITYVVLALLLIILRKSKLIKAILP